MPDKLKKLVVHFYASPSGAEPVRDWLKGLDPDDRRAIGIDIATVEFGWPVGMSTCRSLGDGLWEVRTSLAGGRIARVIFCIENSEIHLLNGFMKKTRTTPKAELDLALKRKRDIEI